MRIIDVIYYIWPITIMRVMMMLIWWSTLITFPHAGRCLTPLVSSIRENLICQRLNRSWRQVLIILRGPSVVCISWPLSILTHSEARRARNYHAWFLELLVPGILSLINSPVRCTFLLLGGTNDRLSNFSI